MEQRKMKKCLALVLALCLLFALCGCEALSLATVAYIILKEVDEE
jgi:hypothetical protein